jgi:hypothetical protein
MYAKNKLNNTKAEFTPNIKDTLLKCNITNVIIDILLNTNIIPNIMDKI